MAIAKNTNVSCQEQAKELAVSTIACLLPPPCASMIASGRYFAALLVFKKRSISSPFASDRAFFGDSE
ncbi:hypothetical protein CEXT_721871 [Caerostris extrusa]|uniref:Uncharacterized protein n=1 Tax=Caerostris extrusa TaxID=172846 RepID=A0AAV4R4C0_CAEEX|nr:hypothetical protein CEXT_721871 [Caerostris extrusa]